MEEQQPSSEEDLWEKIWDQPASTSGKREIPPLELHTAEELMSMDLLPPEWIVPGVLPEGLTILAARPKMGKSWLALNLAVCISHGLPVFGQIDCQPGDVLYLALEDTLRRLKSRYEQITDAPDTRTSGGAKHLSVVIRSLRINEGLPEQIERWIGTAENPRLVIVDTLSKVRPERRSEGDSYAESYIDIAALKTVADSHGISVVVVHHTRKQGADDCLEEVMGSTGFTGAADSILVMKRRRGGNDATLVVTGRDIEDAAVELNWDPDRGMWTMGGGGMSRYTADSTQAKVLEILSIAGEPMGPSDIAIALDDGTSPSAVRMALTRPGTGLLAQNRVERLGTRGKYQLVTFDAYDGDEDNGE